MPGGGARPPPTLPALPEMRGARQYPGEKESTVPPFTCLEANGEPRVLRTPRGEDIMAACGQLKSASELKKGQKVKLR